ncbi:MAG: cytochrome c biogenesis CcdA family protein [Limnochordia bacterium]|jgi:cytochrome c-type biogenesis protein|nr:cytochrome c biogenesis protein CcdA [Bacillota bacterium]
MPQVSLLIALTAGLLSLLSPCVLALLPVYVTYLAGLSVSEGKELDRTPVVINALLFVSGFSLIFILLGASASMLGQLLLRHQGLLRRGAGILVIFLGLHTGGWLSLPFLGQERRVFVSLPGGGINSFLIGMAFAAGWSPCVGPILAAILLYAGTAQTLGQGIALLAAYSLGMGIPFLLIALSLQHWQERLRRILSKGRAITIINGLFLIIIGIMLYTDAFSRLAMLFF